jgi:hypothetical protein
MKTYRAVMLILGVAALAVLSVAAKAQAPSLYRMRLNDTRGGPDSAPNSGSPNPGFTGQ